MRQMARILLAVSLACSAPPAASADVASSAAPTVRCTRVDWLDPVKPIIKVSISGRDFTFLVDTGAEYDGWINADVAKALSLPVVGTVPSDGPDDPTGGLPFYGVASLKIGDMEFTGRKFAEQVKVGSKLPPYDGIIGNGLFAELQAVFDYQRGALIMTDAALLGGESVPFTWGVPQPTLDVAGKPMLVHLDTGNLAGKLILSAAQTQQLQFVSAPVERGSAMTIYGKKPIMEGRLQGEVRYGNSVLDIKDVRWPGALDGGQLGSLGMAGQTVRIDWRNGHVSIAPEAAAPQCD